MDAEERGEEQSQGEEGNGGIDYMEEMRRQIEAMQKEIRQLKEGARGEEERLEQAAEEDEEVEKDEEVEEDEEGDREEMQSSDTYREIQRQTGKALRKQAEDLRARELELRGEERRFSNQNRRIILKFILSLFGIWIVFSLFRLMITDDVQMLTAGTAVLSGPLGLVIGYYYAKEDKDDSKRHQN